VGGERSERVRVRITQMPRLQLSLACWDYDRTRALAEGSERPGCAPARSSCRSDSTTRKARSTASSRRSTPIRWRF